MVLIVKNLPAHAGDVRDTGLSPSSGRSLGGGNGARERRLRIPGGQMQFYAVGSGGSIAYS